MLNLDGSKKATDSNSGVKALNATLTDIKLGFSAQGRCARILFSSWRLCSLRGTCHGRRPSLDVNHRRSPPCSRNSVRCTYTKLEHLNRSAACSQAQCNSSMTHTELALLLRHYTLIYLFLNPTQTKTSAARFESWTLVFFQKNARIWEQIWSNFPCSISDRLSILNKQFSAAAF